MGNSWSFFSASFPIPSLSQGINARMTHMAKRSGKILRSSGLQKQPDQINGFQSGVLFVVGVLK